MSKWDLMLNEELKKQTIDLHQFVRQCCYGLKVKPEQVIDELLDHDNEQEIKAGDMAPDALRAHINTWLDDGMLYLSGKKLG